MKSPVLPLILLNILSTAAWIREFSGADTDMEKLSVNKNLDPVERYSLGEGITTFSWLFAKIRPNDNPRKIRRVLII
jgi:hypothetical protein